jgi:hypothetical protein
MTVAIHKLEKLALPALRRMQALAKEQFPAIHSMHFRLDDGVFGENAVTILAVLEDSFLSEAKKLGRSRVDFSDFVRLTLVQLFAEAELDLQPYLRLMSVQDFTALQSSGSNPWLPIPDAD